MSIIGISSGGVGRLTNVDRMVQAVLEQSGHDTEFVKLTELDYSACRGCVWLCAAPQVCMLEDDLLPYYQKVKDADAVVLGTSVYFGMVNAAMNSFVERFFGYRHVDITIARKPFVLVIGGGGRDLDKVEKQFREMLQPFGVKVLEVVKYSSGIPPCMSCGRHKECSIGGLYGAIGKAAHTLDIRPEHFRRWEDWHPVTEAIEAAGKKLRDL